MSNCSKVTRNLKVFCLLFAVFSLNQSTNAAYFDGCDYVNNINPGNSYLESPNYPNSYPSNSSCRYKFVAPLDYVITINCTINLDKGADNCTTEDFYLARDGDTLLRDSEKFCGSGTFIRKTVFRSLVFAYISRGSRGSFRCQMYAEPQPCDCGWSVNTKIANGQAASPNEYPSMVALIEIPSGSIFCGAAIISHRYLLTAAHCARVQRNPENILAWVGRQNIKKFPDTKYSALYYINRISVHPDYTANTVNNEIAILETTTDIEWSRGVGPICLPPASQANNNFANKNVDVTGWGRTSIFGRTSHILRKVTLMVTDYQTCNKFYQNVIPIYQSQICTYDNSGTQKDTCQFDNGGPVVFKYNRQFILGIIGFDRGCGGDDAPGINTRITSYLQWIYQNSLYSTCNVTMYG